MKVILIGNTAVHHTLAAACLLAKDMGAADWCRSEAFGDMSRDRQGEPIFIGKDRWGNQIYTAGAGWEPDIGVKVVKSFVHLIEEGHQTVIVKRITVRGETLVGLAGIIDGIPWIGRTLNRWLSRQLIEWNWRSITWQVEMLQARLNQQIYERTQTA